MDKEIIRVKCDRVLIDKKLLFSQILNNRLQKVYINHSDAIGQKLDYELLTDFTSDILTAFTGVISEVMVDIIQEVLSDDSFEDLM